MPDGREIWHQPHSKNTGRNGKHDPGKSRNGTRFLQSPPGDLHGYNRDRDSQPSPSGPDLRPTVRTVPMSGKRGKAAPARQPGTATGANHSVFNLLPVHCPV